MPPDLPAPVAANRSVERSPAAPSSRWQSQFATHSLDNLSAGLKGKGLVTSVHTHPDVQPARAILAGATALCVAVDATTAQGREPAGRRRLEGDADGVLRTAPTPGFMHHVPDWDAATNASTAP